MILHKHQTEETCLRLYKLISGALFTSATRWSRLRQFDGRGFAKRGVISKVSRALRAIITFSTPLMQGLMLHVYKVPG